MSDIILSYHDSLLRQSDLKLLQGNRWINDNIIEFWFEYLTHDLFKGRNLLAIGPSFAQLLKLTSSDEETEALLAPLELDTKELALIAINNHTDSEEAGGSHWSLLVLHVGRLRFEHFDSLMHSSNVSHARTLAGRLHSHLLRQKRGSVPAHLNLVIMTCSQQQDSYNCGIHVIVNARAAAERYFALYHAEAAAYVHDKATNQDAVEDCRQQLLCLIERLRTSSSS